MESSSPENNGPGWRRASSDRGAARRPLVVRRRIERHAARGRIANRTRHALTPVQLAFDPLARPSRSRRRRIARIILAILGSLLLHAAAVGVGVAWRTRIHEAEREEVKIEVRQRLPPPPPQPPAPPPPVEKPTRVPPKIVKAPLPPPPVNVPKPVRVVGLSLESTTEGGGGPAFAVGNTRLGETAERATAPKDVSAAPAAVPNEGLRGPARSNQIASHIPVAGVKYELPKRRHPRQPPYPSTLKSQGIEGDVPVLVVIDATGKVTSVKILKPSPYPEFDEAARSTALAEEFEPATRDGVPMSYTLSYTYRFRLEDL